MKIKEQFTTLDENDTPDDSAIFYMKRNDLQDLMFALQIAENTPKTKFLGKTARFKHWPNNLNKPLRFL